MTARIMPGADVDDRAVVGAGTIVWHLAQVREGAHVGEDCIVGRGAYVDVGVEVGDRSKIQNHALLYAPARLGPGAFVGPAVVLANDAHPRAIHRDGAVMTGADWSPEGVQIDRGASLGARAVVLPGVTIGAWAMVAAGAVVTRDVRAHALVVGTPAVQRGWVGHAGVTLERTSGREWRCPRTGTRYRERSEGGIREVPGGDPVTEGPE